MIRLELIQISPLWPKQSLSTNFQHTHSRKSSIILIENSIMYIEVTCCEYKLYNFIYFKLKKIFFLPKAGLEPATTEASILCSTN